MEIEVLGSKRSEYVSDKTVPVLFRESCLLVVCLLQSALSLLDEVGYKCTKSGVANLHNHGWYELPLCVAD